MVITPIHYAMPGVPTDGAAAAPQIYTNGVSRLVNELWIYA